MTIWNDKLLQNKVAIVFGGGSCGEGWGNGKAAALAYARSGASVTVVDINLEAAEETKELIEKEDGQCLAMRADVTDSVAVKDVFEQTLQQFNGVHILHNNVGICKPGDPVSMTEEDWDMSMDCNIKSVFLSCKYALPVMQEQGFGVITNISSILSVRVSQYDEIAYYASKAAVNHFTKSVAVKYASQGIRANSILPGLIHTPLLYANKDVVENSHGSIEQMIIDRDKASPTGKMGSAWDIAKLAVFLASDSASYINGVEIPVDGGLICKQAGA